MGYPIHYFWRLLSEGSGLMEDFVSAVKNVVCADTCVQCPRAMDYAKLGSIRSVYRVLHRLTVTRNYYNYFILFLKRHLFVHCPLMADVEHVLLRLVFFAHDGQRKAPKSYRLH